MMQSEAPEVMERLDAALLDYVKAKNGNIQRAGGLILRRAYTDDCGMFEVIDISVEDVETSSFMKNDRDAMFIAIKGCWAVFSGGKFTDVDESHSFRIDKQTAFRISPSDYAAKAILVINGAR